MLEINETMVSEYHHYLTQQQLEKETYFFPNFLFLNFSFGWLRLLHHCITVASESSNELKNSVISAAATTDGLLEACCGLLLVPAPVFITPCLERVLLVLGLHDSQLGLKMIDTLLNNGASPFHQGM